MLIFDKLSKNLFLNNSFINYKNAPVTGRDRLKLGSISEKMNNYLIYDKNKLQRLGIRRIMLNSIDLSSQQYHTDLAVEARDLVRGATGQEVHGVIEEKQTFAYGTITIIKIIEEEAEKVMGKPRGTYITIEAPELKFKSPEVQVSVAEALSGQLRNLLQLTGQETALIIGLGNWQATPDALGPSVVKYTLITRHLFKHMPEAVENYLSVCAIAPGVLGITGIETAEIIRGVVEKVQPNVIIAIDALAAANIGRLGTTIQISDTGITPGSGVNNKRAEINFHTMGVPVIAIGVPTVVNASVIGRAVLETYANKFARGKQHPVYIQETISDVLEPFQGALVVTPREIDDLIENASRTINRGITMALHSKVPQEELSALIS
jgi:spore protease